MNAVTAGIVGLIWVTIAVIVLILSFFGGDILAAIVFLALVFATPFVLNKTCDVL
jgi:hypothetical protein